MIDLSNTDIVLLSAGVGKRLGKIGKIKPKSLIKIGNKTLISRLIEILKKRKAEKINILVGYKSNLIKKELKKIENIKINYVSVKDYKKYGHAFTWYKYKKYWSKKNSFLLIHTDIIFNVKLLDNIISSNSKNIVGVKSLGKNKLKAKTFVVKSNKKNYIERISYIENMSDFSSEIVGINKLSKKIMGQFFNFMKIKFKTKRNKFLSWEQVLDMFIVEKKPLITALNKQFSPWVNINTTEDIKKAKRTFSKI
tara:strand:+ start:390 stop:1145 length:756 start_codon:yes stop_codon:yes gene_type:complete